MGDERADGAERPSGGAASRGALELRGPAATLLDDALELSARGSGGEPLTWFARMKDDDGRVWRAVAERAEDLPDAWTPAKAGAGTGPVAALQSLRPVSLDVRAEAADGRAASRSFTRRLLADGVRVRRWREPVEGTLFLPGERPSTGEPSAPWPSAAVVLDAAAPAASLAAALLASRGVLVFAVAPRRADDAPGARLASAVDLLAAVPAASAAPGGIGLLDEPLPVPPGVPVVDGDDLSTRAAAWVRLRARLGAR